MMARCLRNGCEEDATWRVHREIAGARYELPVCERHASDLGVEHV